METITINFKLIYLLNLLLSLCTALYAYFVMHVAKVGFFNGTLFTSKKDMDAINVSSFVFPLVFSVAFMIADTIVWFVRWDVPVILLSLGFKIITYKAYEYYYIRKAKKVYNEIHQYYPSFHGTKILCCTIFILPLVQIVFLWRFYFAGVVVAAIIESVIMYLLYRARRYQCVIYAIKVFEALTLLCMLYLMYDVGHPLMYAALIGLLVIL